MAAESTAHPTAHQVGEWFDDNGLPYFVADRAHAIEAWLNNKRILGFLLVLLIVSIALGYTAGRLIDASSVGTLVGVFLFVATAAAYAGGLLRMGVVLRWALRRTFSSLSLMFSLVTRALPLLLLFITFLFINTEVWQVASSMRRDVLWIVVLFFAGIALVFLLVRLPDEVRKVEADTADDRLVDRCAGTPVAGLVARGSRAGATAGADVELPRLARTNLVLVLLFNQAIQVLLLSVAVFAFFLVFGSLAINDEVIKSWLGAGHPEAIRIFGQTLTKRPSNELFQVSVFLSAFSGLYFTVYAVTDQTYREQFFSSISRELEAAIGVHAVYRSMLVRRP